MHDEAGVALDGGGVGLVVVDAVAVVGERTEPEEAHRVGRQREPPVGVRRSSGRSRRGRSPWAGGAVGLGAVDDVLLLDADRGAAHAQLVAHGHEGQLPAAPALHRDVGQGRPAGQLGAHRDRPVPVVAAAREHPAPVVDRRRKWPSAGWPVRAELGARGWSSRVNQCHSGGSASPGPSGGGSVSSRAANAAAGQGSTRRALCTEPGAHPSSASVSEVEAALRVTTAPFGVVRARRLSL